MIVKLKKIEMYWVVLGWLEDGTRFDYRFQTKKEAQVYMKKLGLEETK